ncbi:MAG TPA: amino acid permease [Thermoanaerobaculia bacterium]|nr:amino acid permease [Thermoanaerobaculia bacterium]
MAPTPPAPSLERRIGRLDATALVVGSMIGSGIFIVSAESARLLGSPGGLLLTWVVAGALTLAAASSCAELAAMLPRAGGQYVFFREAYGPLAGFLFGWAMFLVIQTGTIAAVAVAFARFLGVLVPSVSSAPWVAAGPLSLSSVQLVALAVIALLTASNATGLKAGTRTQNVFTAAKLAALLGLALAGLVLGRSGVAFPGPAFFDARGVSGQTLSGFALTAAFAAALVGPLFSQSAWNNVAFAGEEIRDPGRNLPFALLVGCLVVAVLYVLTNVAYLRALPFAGIQHAPEDRVGTAAAGALFGAAGPPLAAAAILVSTFGCVNGLVLSGARVSFAMARDGLFFRGLERLNAARVPAAALWLQAAWAGVLVLSGTYSQLLRYVISADLVLYVGLVLAVVALRRRRPEWPRPYRAAAYPWLPLLYAAAGLLLIALLLAGNPGGTWPGYAMLATGVPAYFFWRRRS